MIIHQIFFKFTDKTFQDFPCYDIGMKKWQSLCDKYGWEYRLHTEVDESIMTEEEIKIMKLGKEKYPFYVQNYYRLILLTKFGGLYADLDVFPTENFEKIKDNEIIIGRSVETNKKNNYDVNDNILKFTPELANKLLRYMIEQTEEKLKIKVYETWRIRFYLQTTGAQMFARFCKTNNLKVLDDWGDYFIDHNTQAWDKLNLQK
tara:strand:- start:1758 stop:2369 length:612 start_codon:yes stop_codon:yes gene_type:complete